jgi:hypothetical protein
VTQAQEIKALRDEIAELRREVEALRAAGAVHHHYHYPPALPPAPVIPYVLYPTWSQPYWSVIPPVTCGSTVTISGGTAHNAIEGSCG